jgi:hypothetical protein
MLAMIAQNRLFFCIEVKIIYDDAVPLVLHGPSHVTTIIRVRFHVDWGYCIGA